jgi:hypothetical protein
MKRITVQPGGPDRRVPVENIKGTYFDQGVPREVYHTHYVARCIADGDLVEVNADGKPVEAAAAAIQHGE